MVLETWNFVLFKQESVKISGLQTLVVLVVPIKVDLRGYLSLGKERRRLNDTRKRPSIDVVRLETKVDV